MAYVSKYLRMDSATKSPEYLPPGFDPDDHSSLIKGKKWNDSINGGYGDDTIYGGRGDDTLNGGQNSDRLYGGHGNDDLSGGQFTYLGYNNDYLNGGPGNDTLWGGLGSNTLIGGSGDDVLYGSPNAIGVPAANLMNGGKGNDTIYSGFGGDTIMAGKGNDVIYFGESEDAPRYREDLIYGGLGHDTFILRGGTGREGNFARILDFTRGEDKIDMSRLGLSFEDLSFVPVYSEDKGRGQQVRFSYLDDDDVLQVTSFEVYDGTNSPLNLFEESDFIF